MDFAELVDNDVKDVFLNGEFSQTAIFKSTTSMIELDVQFFEQALDGLETSYFHAWASVSDIQGIQKNDTLEIKGVIYGIVDFTPDEFNSGINIFLQEV